MKYIHSLLLFTLVFFIQSCEKKSNKEKAVNSKIRTADTINNDIYVETKNNLDDNIVFPKIGNKKFDFVPHSFEIQYEADGDLNKDGLNDIVLVLKYPLDDKSSRPILVLLRKEDNSLQLDKFSKVVIPVEYNEHNFKLYDTEDISIENGELNINLYSIGPNGTIFGSFKYIEKDFILTKIEAFYRGAGGSSEIVYDFSKDEIITTETNTMEENLPSVTETIKNNKQKHLFENTSITNFFNEDE